MYARVKGPCPTGALTFCSCLLIASWTQAQVLDPHITQQKAMVNHCYIFFILVFRFCCFVFSFYVENPTMIPK